jgi:LEA14-like dessication related protein
MNSTTRNHKNKRKEMKKTIVFLSALGAILFFSGCNIWNQITGAYNLSQCEFTYHSVDNIQLAGINLGNGSGMSLANMASIATILAGGGNLQIIPFNMVLKMNVKNPNEAAAFLNALDYTIEINDLEFITGKMDIPIRIEPQQTTVLPLNISVDLKSLMNRYSQQRVANVLNSFLGISPDETKVVVKLWPKVMVGKTPIKSPAAIPVVFTFGGK